MEKAPKIVAERLKAAAVAMDHPDADLLTAFSEHALPERERTQVLEHLARCAECRQVVVLSLPAEEPTVAGVRPFRGRWLTWPQLRWGLVAAGVIVVGSFGVLRYEQSRHPAMVASDQRSSVRGVSKDSKQPAEAPAASAEEPRKEMAAVPAAKSSSALADSQREAQSREFDRLDSLAKLQSPRDQENRGESGKRTFHGALAHGPKPPVQWQQNLNQQNTRLNANNDLYAFRQTPAPAAAPIAGLPSNGRLVSAQSVPPSKTGSAVGGPLVVDKRALDLNTLALEGKSVSPLPAPSGSAGGEVARAKPAEPPAVNVPRAESAYGYDVSGANAASNFAPTAPLKPESARWSITAMGGLQRSLDQGMTWQDVDVTGATEQAAAMNLQKAMKSSPQKSLSKDKADLKQAPVVFRAVAANGPDVWAGGSAGNLYHSTDGGAHWVRVVPIWYGVVLTDNIVSLQFADPQQCRIVTSSSEIWTTSDAGQTWQKH